MYFTLKMFLRKWERNIGCLIKFLIFWFYLQCPSNFWLSYSSSSYIHLLMSTLTPISIKVKYYLIKNSNNEQHLGVTVDANLNFNNQLQNILWKLSKTVHVLVRIAPYMSISKRELLMNSFFTS